MPNGDGTGPMGQGPQTGRGVGRCGMLVRGGGYGGVGKRFSCFGGGRATPVTLSKEEQKKILQEEKKGIEKMLKELE